MAVALENFVKQLADSGIIAPGKLENFIPPKAHPKDAQELARQLVESKQLTRFQAQEIYQGRAKALFLGNYTILDRIGAGGMGQVFTAEHRRMKRQVAIKVLPKAMTKDPATLARFQREVEAAAKLTHANIVEAHDADEAGGVHFLVMQYVEGSDLAAVVRKNGPLSVPLAVNYILQAARGLEFAHGEGVVHRDIKPSNLLVDKKGVVRILDMGLARLSGDEAKQAELTGTGAVMGTVDYMAPEQALDTKHADARADIYSLGCTLYFLLTGHPSYEGDTITAKLLAHQNQAIPELRKARPEVPPQLDAVFRKMVAKKVDDRYQTMREVAAALEQCGAGLHTVTSVQPVVSTDANEGVLTFIKPAPAGTAHKPGPAPQPAAHPPGQSKRRMIVAAAAGGVVGLAILATIILLLRTKDGTLVLTINRPDAVVQIDDNQVTIGAPGADGAVSISVDPGKHRLKVEKAGFQFFAQEFEIGSGENKSITATLLPLAGNTNHPAVVGVNQQGHPWKTPAFQQWMKDVAALPAERQVEAVTKKLQEVNPGFEGDVKSKIDNGLVTELRLLTDNVTDISPVRALAKLKSLVCVGHYPRKGKLSDLSPLQGLQLTDLDCRDTQVSDLSPLAAMPLTSLFVGDTQVADLAPLTGMPLTHLWCYQTPISDLSPLARMRLEVLDCHGTGVRDLSPLKGMPLHGLVCWHTEVSDLSPLVGMSLVGLDISYTRVSDLAALQGMHLEKLSCAYTPIASLSPVHGMPLTKLLCSDTQVSDLSPLAGMSLTEVTLTPQKITKGIDIIRQMTSLTKIGVSWDPDQWLVPAEFWTKYDAGEFGKSITALNDPAFQQWMKDVAALPAEKQVEAVAKKLQELNPGFDGQESHKIEGVAVTELTLVADDLKDISPVRALWGLQRLNLKASANRRSELADLAPLAGLKLTHLDCHSTHVADLSPLKGMPLDRLGIQNTDVADLSPIKGVPLAELYCQQTAIADLTPLTGSQLGNLYCDGSKIADLTPLAGMQLKNLSICDTPISDLTPLAGMHLRSLTFTPSNIRVGLDTVRRMPGIQEIGAAWNDVVAPERFWSRYDAGEFKKPTTPAPVTPVETSVAKDFRVPVPDEAARLKAEKLLQELFQADLAQAKLPEQKSALADKLLKQAEATRDDPTSQYVMLQEALRLGVEAADMQILDRAIRSLAITYVVDGSQTWIDALEKAAQKPRLPAVNKRLAETAVDHVDEAAADDNYELAARFQSVAFAAAQKAHDAALLKNVVERGKTLAAAKQQWSAAQQAAAVLATSPDDPAANLTLGKYLCLNKGDWRQGFARLAKGSDAVLAGLASESLADPADPAAQEALGDAWWKAAEAAKGTNKADLLRSGSAFWYSTALPRLTGLAKARVQKRLDSLPAPAAKSAAQPAAKQADAPFFEFDGFNGFWGSPGVPDDAYKLLKKVQGENRAELKCFAFTPEGDWIFLYNGNGYYTNNTNLPACQKLSELQGLPGMDFKCVAFAPTGGWTILWDENGNWTKGGVPPAAFGKIQEVVKKGGTLRSVAFGPNGAWVLMYEKSGVSYGNVPDSLAKILDNAAKNGLSVVCVDFFGSDWICLTSGGWWSSNAALPAAKLIERNIKQGHLPKWIAVKPSAAAARAPDVSRPAAADAGFRERSWEAPAFKAWIKGVASLPAEQQVAAVAKKLQDLNSGFDGTVTPTIENGVVTELVFSTDHVTDISPVRALAGLQRLNCHGTGKGKRQLSDLSPLQGMHLTDLTCGFSHVADLSPLAGMQLASLHCGWSQISDLSPLKGMPLVELHCDVTQVTDLSPLQGMRLRILNCSQDHRISDLSPLKGMKLTKLSCNDTNVSDLSPIKGMPLAMLYASNTQISDLSPLAGMNLSEIAFTPRQIRAGLEILRQMPSLQKLRITPFEPAKSPAEFWKKYDAGDFK